MGSGYIKLLILRVRQSLSDEFCAFQKEGLHSVHICYDSNTI